jgi:cytochrome P450
VTASAPPRPATAVPGPRGLPLLGSGPALVRDPLGTYRHAMETYGDIVRLVAGPPGRRAVLHALFAPDHARQVLAGTRGHTKQLPLYREIAAALGDGLLTSDGDDWQRQRRLVQPLFTRQRTAGYATVMAEEATRLLEGWEAAAACGRPLELHREMTGYTMRVLGRLLLGGDGDVLCDATFVLAGRGQLTIEGAGLTFAVTGGTGEFRKARGQMHETFLPTGEFRFSFALHR